MRRPAARTVAAGSLLTVFLLAACHREPSFDERYASAQTVLHSEVTEIDSELAQRESEAAAADAVLGGQIAIPTTSPR